jgi:excisionase family DNA binding protein
MSSSRLYSTEDVADLLGLHVRTIRSYVREGKLRAVRIGKQYRIAHDDVVEFTGGDVEASRPGATAVEVTSIVNVEGVDAALLDRLTSLIGGASGLGGTGRTRLSVETMWDEERQTAKVIVVGGADDVARLLTLLGSFAEHQ